MASRSDMDTQMEYNYLVESLHNQLNTVILDRHINRSVDRFVFILVEDVDKGIKTNIERINLNFGRMGPRRRQEK